MALFELVDQMGGAAPPGPWQVRPAPPGPAGLAFGAAEEPGAPLWRADLPGDGGAALTALAAGEAELLRYEAALAAAPGRITALAGGAASFGGPGLPAPEQGLLAALDALRVGPGAASFSAGGGEAPAWAAAEERLRAFVAGAQAAMSNLAVVETRVAGALVARTSVSWTGDVRSLLPAASPGLHAGLHRRTLGLALRSRAALLRTFGTVMRGAAIVAAMAGSPAGAVLALPAAWRFVEELLAERAGV